jgi:hypothetical protein
MITLYCSLLREHTEDDLLASRFQEIFEDHGGEGGGFCWGPGGVHAVWYLACLERATDGIEHALRKGIIRNVESSGVEAWTEEDPSAIQVYRKVRKMQVEIICLHVHFLPFSQFPSSFTVLTVTLRCPNVPGV